MDPDTVPRSSTETSVTHRVVAAVAEATDSDALDLEPLNTVVDPDALEALFDRNGRGSDRSPRRVEFMYGGQTVTIEGDGSIRVTG